MGVYTINHAVLFSSFAYFWFVSRVISQFTRLDCINSQLSKYFQLEKLKCFILHYKNHI